MIDTGKLEELIDQAMVEEDAFLVDYNIDAANSIHIKADTKEGISLEQLDASAGR
ncbi:MAG: hypothetical protein U5L96_19810 [Owenweeksia sp.]|nr:hypothetical protein [Owenweeksia sp.]